MSDEGDSTSSQRPYLLRAMHEWMTDNDLTPHLLVDSSADGLLAPSGHDQDGKLVLNISDSATRGLVLGNDLVSFEARFGGRPQRVEIPIPAVLGIYARESGNGMLFQEDDAPVPPGPPSPSGTSPKGETSDKPKRPTLKVVK